jgi:hypothetical protein
MALAIAAGFIGVGVRDLPRRVADPRNVRFSPEAKCRPQCQLFRPKRRGAGIGGVIPRPVESLPHAPVPAVPLPCAPGHLCPRLNAYVTVIVGKMVVQRSPQRSLIPHDHVVQALASDGAHQPFRKGILPGGSRRSKHFLHSYISDHGGEVSSVDGISIAQHISRRLVPGEWFPHLLHGPLLTGMFRHPEVHHPAPLMR